MPTALPANPSLEQLKKQAKDLLDAHAGHLAVCLPILKNLNRFKDSTDQAVFSANLKLADVHFALAMEYGFKTWEELLRHLEDRQLGLGEPAARAWARIRRNGTLAGLIGGEPGKVSGSWDIGWVRLDVEGPAGRFTVEEEEPGGGTWRLQCQQRLGEFLNANGVQAPRVTLLEVEGRTYGVHRHLEGTPVGQVELSPSEILIYGEDMARLLDRMHAVPLADALRILGLPPTAPEAAARQFRYGGYLVVDAMEAALAAELAADKALKDVWGELRAWITAFVSTPADLVFGHGDMWSHDPLVTKTPEGWRLSGVVGLHNAGLMNLYDEFLRVAGLGYFIEDPVNERAVLEAYRKIPGTRRVEEEPLRHAIAAFWFYLSWENTAENRTKFLANAKATLRGR